jgi:predicted Zn finger-like uncharacterized protein
MGLFGRFKYWLQSVMVGRNGTDQLARAMMWLGIGLLVAAMVLSSYVLNLISIAVYALAVVRIFSRNIAKRSAENRFYVSKTTQIRKAIAHRRARFQNRKQYRYFKCPNCKAWLRVPRGAGQVKVTCGKCKHQFSYIAK